MDAPVRTAAELPPEFFEQVAARLSRRQRLESSLFAQLGVVAAQLALEDAGLDLRVEDRARVGLVIGTAAGGGLAVEPRLARCNGEIGPRIGDLHGIVHSMTNAAVGSASVILGIEGPSLATVGITAGGEAIACAFSLLQLGHADVMLAGAAEAVLSPCALTFFDCLGLLSHCEVPARACRPFDRERDGTVLGDGAGVVVLETRLHAARRAARGYAELCGYGMSGPNQRRPEIAMSHAIRKALVTSGIQPGSIEFVSATGTATQAADLAETVALKTVLGSHAYAVPVTAPKSMTGHTLGAAGAIETVVAALSLFHGVIPPTINNETPDPGCDLFYTPNRAIARNPRRAIVNSFGTDGHGNALVLQQEGL
jgi:3-oxoacyl-(acyl-carrier-protein) synthase